MEQTYHYYAFISYATADSKWAKWLQHQLSYYHIPSAIKKSKIGIPQKLRPIFIYEYDLAGNQLHKAIKQELEASKYLIVICSPNSAKSIYVNREVQTFIEQGRAEYIIPFIVSGEVNVKNVNYECFSPSLLELLNSKDKNNEIRGINVSTNGKRQALVDVVATMLNVRRDVLWNRYKVRLLKQRITIFTLCFIALLCGLFYWDYTRPTYKYYADYVDCWGIPQGIIEINKKEIKHRTGTYQFEFRRVPINEPNAYQWRLNKVAHINSFGYPCTINGIENSDRYPIVELLYSSQNGILTGKVLYSANGNILARHKISQRNGVKATVIDIESSRDGESVGYAPTHSIISQNSKENTKTSITRYVHLRDNKGHIVQTSYHSNNSDNLEESAIADNNGVWGIDYELDSLGRKIVLKYLDKEYQANRNIIGVASIHYKYDNNGIIIEDQYRNLNGDLVLNEYHWAIGKVVCDNYGNNIEETYYGVDGEPCFDSDGVSKVIIEYDKHENKSVSFYDIQGNPCLNKQGMAGYVNKFDKYGNAVALYQYNLNKELCMTTNGCAIWKCKYNKYGNIIEESFYNEKGDPFIWNHGYAKYVNKYNRKGQRLSMTCYGIDGEMCWHKEGFSQIKYKCDSQGNEIEEAYYGVDGEPCIYMNGYSKFQAKFDERGLLIEKSFYGLDNKLCLCNDGYATIKYQYDNKGNNIETSYYDTDRKMTYKTVYKYDGNSNLIEESYYDSEGYPIIIGNYAKALFGYDKQSNLVYEAIFNTSNKLLRAVAYEYDDYGNQTMYAFYGSDGKLQLNSDNYAKYTTTYDDKGNRLEMACYDIDGNLCMHREGFARIEYKCDERGNEIEEAYFDIDGNPCIVQDLYAKFQTKFDERGLLTEKSFYDVDGKLCKYLNQYAIITYKYDGFGNITEEAYFDENGSPYKNVEKVAKKVYKYDNSSRIIETAYYDTDGKPCLSIYENYMEMKKYDERGNMTEISYYDTDNKLCATYKGYIVTSYNKRDYITGRIVNEVSQRVELSEIKNCAKTIYKYNERGNKTEESYYDVNDKLCNNEMESAIVSYKYDRFNNIIEESHFGIDKLPCLNKYGYSIEKSIYNYTTCIERSYYGITGEPCCCDLFFNYHRIVYYEKSSDSNIRRFYEYYDIDGNLIGNGNYNIY